MHLLWRERAKSHLASSEVGDNRVYMTPNFGGLCSVVEEEYQQEWCKSYDCEKENREEAQDLFIGMRQAKKGSPNILPAVVLRVPRSLFSCRRKNLGKDAFLLSCVSMRGLRGVIHMRALTHRAPRKRSTPRGGEGNAEMTKYAARLFGL